MQVCFDTCFACRSFTNDALNWAHAPRDTDRLARLSYEPTGEGGGMRNKHVVASVGSVPGGSPSQRVFGGGEILLPESAESSEHPSTYTYICMFMYACVYECLWKYTYMYIRRYVYVLTCMNICRYMYTYIYL